MVESMQEYLKQVAGELGRSAADLAPLQQRLEANWYTDVASLRAISVDELLRMDFPLRLAWRLVQQGSMAAEVKKPCYASSLYTRTTFLVAVLAGPISALRFMMTCRRLLRKGPVLNNYLTQEYLTACRTGYMTACRTGYKTLQSRLASDLQIHLAAGCAYVPSFAKVRFRMTTFSPLEAKVGTATLQDPAWLRVCVCRNWHRCQKGKDCRTVAWSDILAIDGCNIPTAMPELKEKNIAITLCPLAWSCRSSLQSSSLFQSPSLFQLLCASIRAKKTAFLLYIIRLSKPDQRTLGRVLLAVTEGGRAQCEREPCDILVDAGARVSEEDAVCVSDCVVSRCQWHFWGDCWTTCQFAVFADSGPYYGCDMYLHPPENDDFEAQPSHVGGEDDSDDDPHRLRHAWQLYADGGYEFIAYAFHAGDRPPMHGWRLTQLARVDGEKIPTLRPVKISDLIELPSQSSKYEARFARHGEGKQHDSVPRCEDGEISLHADDQGLQIGRAISASGQELPLGEAFSQMRMVLRGQRFASNSVKVEEEEDRPEREVVVLPCDRIRFTQEGISARFKDGRSLESTIEALLSQVIDPQKDDRFTLEVVRRNGSLFSIDNRRLYCMKEAQRRACCSDRLAIVWVKARIYNWNPMFDKFLDHLDHNCTGSAGVEVTVRPRKWQRIR